MISLRTILTSYALPFIASVIPVAALLILFEVHSAVIRQGQTLIGIRPDTPVILATGDGCGRFKYRISLLQGFDRQNPHQTDSKGCEDEISILAAKRPGAGISLYINNEPIARSQGGTNRIARFEGIKLTQAMNVLQVASDNSVIWRPFGSSGMPAEFLYFNEKFEREERSFWEPPRILPLDRIAVTGPTTPHPLTEVDTWELEDGTFVKLVSGYPVSVLPEFASQLDLSPRNLTDPAGLALIEVRSNTKSRLKGSHFYRRLRLERDAENAIVVIAKTCLPMGHPYRNRILPAGKDSEPGVLPISGQLFVARFFSLQVGQMTADSSVSQPDRVAVHFEGSEPGECRPVSATFTVKGGFFLLRQDSPTSFPNLPRDELELVGFDNDVYRSGVVPSATIADTQRWQGSKKELGKHRYLDLAYYSWRSSGVAVEKYDEKLFAQYRKIFESLPNTLRNLLYGIAPVVPAILILFVITQSVRDEDVDRRTLSIASRGLYALVFFGVAWALQPYAHGLAYWLMDLVEIDRTIRDPASRIWSRSNESLPAAILIVVLALVLLDRDPTKMPPRSNRVLSAVGYLLNIIISVALVALGIAALRFQDLVASESGIDEVVALASTQSWLAWIDTRLFTAYAAPLWLTVAWSVAVTAFATITVCWVLRTLSGPIKLSTAVGATITIFLLTLTPTLFDTIAMSVAIAAPVLSFVPTTPGIWHFALSATEFLATHSPSAILFMLSYLVFLRLVAFVREGVPAQAWLSIHAMALSAACLVTVSLAEPQPIGQQTLNSSVILLTGLAQSYAPLLALMLGILVLGAMKTQAPKDQIPSHKVDPFNLPESAYVVGTAVFAGYVATWSLNPVILLPVLAVGWFAFNHYILADIAQHQPFSADLGPRYLAYLKVRHLADEARDAARKSYAKGDCDIKDYKLRVNQANNLECDAVATLTHVELTSGKVILLGRGPAASPMRNGMLGAMAGLVIALILQALMPLNSSLEDAGVGGGLLIFASLLLTETQYDIIRNSDTTPAVWLAVTGIANALILWVTAGFLFGFIFHRIRGDDGFVKAVRFSFGVGSAVLVAQAIGGGGGALALAAQVLPISFFMLMTGALVFDAASLRAQGLNYTDLVDVYGLKTSVGYASLVGGLAAMQPLLTLLGSMS